MALSRMNKPIKNLLISTLAVALIPILLWIFKDRFFSFWDWLWDQPDSNITKFNDRLTSLEKVGAIFFGIAGFISAILLWPWKKDTQKETPNPVGNPVAPILPNRDLAKLYYRALDEKCQMVRLEIITPELAGKKLSLSLSDIYQDQHIRLADETKGQDRLPESSESIPLIQALAKLKGKRLVIRGKVGAGKTCFVNYLTHSIIQSQHSTAVELPPSMINRPVARLPLRELGSRLCGEIQPGLLWEAIKADVHQAIILDLKEHGNPELQPVEFGGFWETFRNSFEQQGILLLDGLDEVSEAEHRRENLRTAIAEFAKNAPQVFIIITGRPYAYETDTQRLAGFQQADLEPMTETQIREFIRHWYLTAGHFNNWDAKQAESQAQELAEQIFARPYLPEMASTAMLLTLFIGLDYSGIRLPSSRAKLYEYAVGLLLQRWNQNLINHLASLEDAERRGMEVLKLNDDKLLRALKKLAYQTYEGWQPKPGQSDTPVLDFSHELVIGQLCTGLDTHARDSEHLLYFLQYRSALLVAGNGEDNFQFAHKSFHEYLAASHLLDQPNWRDKVQGLLRDNLEWWREVFLLLVRKYSDGQYGDAVLFLHHLLLGEYPQDGILPATHLQQVLLLAATAGLELAVHTRQDDVLYQKFHHFLQTKLVELLHSPQLSIAERAEAGRLLSELGDPRPGVGCKTRNGELVTRKRGEREYHLPAFDWQEIPAATFHMGTDGSQGDKDEKPAHDVFVPRFFISRYPVTNAQFRCFIQAGLYEDEEFWHDKLPKAARLWLKGSATDEQLIATIPEQSREDYKRWLQADQTRNQPRFWANQQWNADNHPVVGVSWFEALAYSVWLNEILEVIRPEGQTEGFCLRLPTEAEWEYAARGTAGNEYAWGNDPPNASKANYADTGLKRTCAVGLFLPDLAYGLHEVSGNVWEWTLSRWGKDFNRPDFTYEQWQGQENERNLVEPVEFRVTRGGSWNSRTDLVRCAIRNGNHPNIRINGIGFRLVLGSPW